MADSQSALKSYLLATRPKTLIAGISPVIIGGSLAAQEEPFSLFLFTCSLLFSLFIQIGTNFANDYYDYMKGADENRLGPLRAVANGWISPTAMRNASFLIFFLAVCVSLPLVFTCGLWALFFVFLSVAFGILYTGGPKPLGYAGFGDLLVLTFFGPVAVLGTYYVQRHEFSFPLLILSLSPGLLSTAILTANNLRDMATDREVGKNTLIVRWGQKFGALEYIGSILFAALLPLNHGFYFPLLILIIAFPLFRTVLTFKSEKELIPLLPKTAQLLIFYTAFFTLECFTKL